MGVVNAAVVGLVGAHAEQGANRVATPLSESAIGSHHDVGTRRGAIWQRFLSLRPSVQIGESTGMDGASTVGSLLPQRIVIGKHRGLQNEIIIGEF